MEGMDCLEGPERPSAHGRGLAPRGPKAPLRPQKTIGSLISSIFICVQKKS
jgi:hypothetical protein